MIYPAPTKTPDNKTTHPLSINFDAFMQQLDLLNQGKKKPTCFVHPPFNSDFFMLTGLALHLQLERLVKLTWAKYDLAIIQKIQLA